MDKSDDYSLYLLRETITNKQGEVLKLYLSIPCSLTLLFTSMTLNTFANIQKVVDTSMIIEKKRYKVPGILNIFTSKWNNYIALFDNIFDLWLNETITSLMLLMPKIDLNVNMVMHLFNYLTNEIICITAFCLLTPAVQSLKDSMCNEVLPESTCNYRYVKVYMSQLLVSVIRWKCMNKTTHDTLPNLSTVFKHDAKKGAKQLSLFLSSSNDLTFKYRKILDGL
ncbi:hypothetical protein KUTeg_019332 [Tegillarca granosa]|uniref:Uncharacterized protein n=1 Tax=Tegillarca granosa TaxID=220873 RepID=A0ABQ9EGG2_TEGGR|nr:hypothetical protein KUTeg_019332 [Tegillarca granosa]